MGCDIHVFVEKFEDASWRAVGEWKRNDFHDPEDSKSPQQFFESHILIHRNYSLFAILADVRNEEDPLGCLGFLFFRKRPYERGYGWRPIARRRGLPDDVSPEVKQANESWEMESHSHSWLTLREVLDYDWDQGIVTKRRVPIEEAEEYEKRGTAPAMMSRNVSGRDSAGWRTIQFKETARMAAGEFLDEVVPVLQSYGPPEHVRIVFWFDN